MRYLLLASAHVGSSQMSAAQIEHAVAFCRQLEDELATSSELEGYEVLAPPSRAHVFGADGSVSEVAPSEGTLTRVWVVRVAQLDRAHELASRIARELGERVEVRECLAGAQRP